MQYIYTDIGTPRRGATNLYRSGEKETDFQPLESEIATQPIESD